jgi:hypothetical protein
VRAQLVLDAGGPSDGGGTRENSRDASETDVVPAPEVCDGKNGISLAAYMAPQYARAGGAAVSIELGAGFLYVDGHCQFWVWQTGERTAFRTGTLSPENLSAMLADLAYEEWGGLDGVWENHYGYDTPYQVFYSRTRAFVCNGECRDAPLPVRQAYAAGIRWRAVLWEQGTPMLDVPMRVAPYTEEAEDPTAPYGQVATPWPFAVPPAEVQLWVDSPSEPGTGYLVVDPDRANAVRRERDKAALRRATLGLWFAHEGRYYGFDGRDVLPMENDRGLMPRPQVIADWEAQ